MIATRFVLLALCLVAASARSFQARQQPLLVQAFGSKTDEAKGDIKSAGRSVKDAASKGLHNTEDALSNAGSKIKGEAKHVGNKLRFNKEKGKAKAKWWKFWNIGRGRDL